jgi:galactose mutarotase-like enzyme
VSRSARVVRWQRRAAIELTARDTCVRVVPELGMVVGSFEVDGFDHVARPGGLGALATSHTTAVPLLHPWANRLGRSSYSAGGVHVSLDGIALHTDGNGLPMHGTFVGRPEWDVVRLGGGTVECRSTVDERDPTFAVFPFPHAVHVRIEVARARLRVTTGVVATGDRPVPVSFGWHPYWRLPGRRDSWSVELPAVAHARLDRRGIPTGRTRAEAAGRRPLAGVALDELYALDGARAAALVGPRRRLDLTVDDGYPYLQVYAPPGHDFCCIEPMTAPTNALVTGDHPTVPAGARHAATFTASVR